MPFFDTDVPPPRSDCDVNCCDTDLSQSSGLRPRIYRHVLVSLISLSLALTVVNDL